MSRKAIGRRSLVTAALAAPLLSSSGWTQGAWPTKPIRIVVPFNPGGAIDALVRVIAEGLTAKLGQQVLVDPKPGANTIVGAEIVAKSPPDGYTFLITTNSTHTNNPSLYAKLPFDPAKDFVPVSMVFTNANVLVVNANSPVKSVQDLIGHAKQNAGKVNYGSAGNGSTPHLSGEMFRLLTGAPVVHVPYRGSGPAIMDLIGGQLDFAFVDTSVLTHVKAGKLRALAVTGKKRLGVAPELPTMEEAGVKGFYVDTWYSLVAPAGTPPEVVKRLSAEAARMLADPAVRERMRSIGVDPAEEAGAEHLQKVIHSDTVRWKKFLSSTSIRVD
jgi:tripartite-type tricarboxylate transporter receptor subunit TctC